MKGKKFNRQHPVIFSNVFEQCFYSADFCCHDNKLIVEIDGGIHETQKDYGRLRIELLNTRGYRVIRFKNDQVLQDLNDF